jgi:hypothetical protein
VVDDVNEIDRPGDLMSISLWGVRGLLANTLSDFVVAILASSSAFSRRLTSNWLTVWVRVASCVTTGWTCDASNREQYFFVSSTFFK